MVRPSTLISHWRAAGSRLRGRGLAIVQTATAAVAAWYLAVLLLPDPRPAFAAIAAVIAVGATHGQRAVRALQLVGGVVLGLTVAVLLIQLIGTGTWQIGVLVVLAMGAAVALGGGELLVVEAGREAARLSAPRRGARSELGRYESSLGQVDYAVRNTRVLARHVVSLVREGSDVPENLPGAVRDLSHSVWELAASYDSPSRAEPARLAAVHAAGEAASLPDGSADLVMVGGQVRSVAVDLVRAAELVGGEPESPANRPTQELLATV